MKYLYFIAAIASVKSASAGGGASRLDTKFMYEEGNYAEVSHASLDYHVEATTFKPDSASSATYGIEKSVKSNRSRTTASFKTNYGGLDVGFSRYRSGNIQLASSAAGYYNNTATCPGTPADCKSGAVPETDVALDTLTLMGKLKASNNVDVLFGMNRNTVQDSTVTTTRGTYTLQGSSNTSAFLGLAYSKPEIALRVEVLFQPSSKINADTGYVKSTYGAAVDVTTDVT